MNGLSSRISRTNRKVVMGGINGQNYYIKYDISICTDYCFIANPLKSLFFGVEFSCLSYVRYFGVIFIFYRKDQAEASLYPSRPKKVSF
jgi:hypothetical protein